MTGSRLFSAAAGLNAEWTSPPGPVPHTVFDHACINFVNSEFADHAGSGRRFDRLVLREWRHWFLQHHGLVGDGSASRQTVDDLMVLRGRIRRLLEDRSAPSEADIRTFNAVLGASPLTWRLTLEGTQRRLAMRLERIDAGWAAAKALIVSSYAELAVSGGLARVKRCGNESCTFLLFDSTRSGTRRWCDPRACGNLVKVRLHRSRRVR
jgi:predicted RNA-binding Zn ribbon-like protein